jgi:hypothetical protein
METTSSNNKSSSELVNQALIFRKEEKYDKSTKILLDAVYCALGDLAKDYNLEVMTARGQQYFIWIIGEDHIMQLWQEAKSYVLHSRLSFTFECLGLRVSLTFSEKIMVLQTIG